MTLVHLIDLPSAAIVLGGTVLATVLRVGWHDTLATLHALACLPRRRFSGADVRGKLAGQVTEIRRDGILRAHSRHSGDAEFDEATDALLARRSLAALLESHEQHKARRYEMTGAAVRTLAVAAEMAPAFGLVGTLVSLSQLGGGMAQGALAGAISMAVLTTLYGLLTANFVCAPLSRMVARTAEREERDRQAVIDWLSAQIGPSLAANTAVADIAAAQHGSGHSRSRVVSV